MNRMPFVCIVCLITEVRPRAPLLVANKSLSSHNSMNNSSRCSGDSADSFKSLSEGVGEFVAGEPGVCDSTSNNSDKGVNSPRGSALVDGHRGWIDVHNLYDHTTITVNRTERSCH